MGVVTNISVMDTSQLLNTSGIDLLLTDLLSTEIEGRLFYLVFCFFLFIEMFLSFLTCRS